MQATVEGLSEAQLSSQLFEGYRHVTELDRRRTEVATSMDLGKQAILSEVSTERATPPEFFIVDEVADPELAALCLDWFRQLAVKNALTQDITDSINNLSGLAVGRAVRIRSLNPNLAPIRQTYYSGGLYGSRKQELSHWSRPRDAVGTIHSVSPTENRMTIKPIRGRSASLNGGFYKVPVLGENGDSVISIELRQPGLRDKASRIGSILRYAGF